MNFRYKCILQWIFSCLPYSHDWNYLAQKYLTRMTPKFDGKKQLLMPVEAALR
jgi:hypothetical protein